MSNEKFFSISGVACAAHTSETREKWQSLPPDKSKSDYGKSAILKYAKDKGFDTLKIEEGSDITKEAFNFLLNQFPEMNGIKSFILRTAIINYS